MLDEAKAFLVVRQVSQLRHRLEVALGTDGAGSLPAVDAEDLNRRFLHFEAVNPSGR